MKLKCFFGHKYVSMKGNGNYRFDECEWCERCHNVKDLSKFKTVDNSTQDTQSDV